MVEIRDLIRHLAKDHTVILSSHILSEIRAVCDRVLIIRKGRFVVCDTPEDLEEKLSAGGSLELTAKAAPEAAEAVLDRVAGITGRTLLGRTEDTARFAIHMERDIREALFFAFAEAGLPLLELRPRTASLEEVFLDLTDDNETVAARAAAFRSRVQAPSRGRPRQGLPPKEHPSRPPASSTSATPSGVRRLRARSQRPVPFSPPRAIRLPVSPGRRS